MAFETLLGFFEMGGHGAYVWSAYGISLVLISTVALHTLKQNIQARAKLRRRLSLTIREK